MTREDIFRLEQKLQHSNNVIIMGAGASVATMKALELPYPSAMENFIENAGLGHILKDVNLHTTSNNLEDIYSELYDRPEYTAQRIELENGIYQYMSTFRLPTNQVSLYDLLFLCSKHDDCIATFNWDGLLLQAYYRVATWLQTWGIRNPFTLLPTPIFLHGNVGVGICLKDHQFGENGHICTQCGAILEQTPLLYPITHKDYISNPYIKDAWDRLKNNLQYSQFLTIFGYGTPKSDADILKIFKDNFGDVKKKLIYRVEIVDIKKQDDLYKAWKKFIGFNGTPCWDKITDTLFFQYPHQSINVQIQRDLYGNWFGEPVNYPIRMTISQAKEIFLAKWEELSVKSRDIN